jgi:DNA-directed RNA polymerase specialized sigma24 family protein
MNARLTVEAFAKLLEAFDADRQRAGERYEDLRRTLIRFFEWRGAPFPEDHTDETFNRVARKLDEGVVVKNIGAYCYEVARLVCLEALKSPDTKRSPLESINPQATTAAATDEALEKERRLSCLEECLNGLSLESRELIMEYYRDAAGRRIHHRKALAERLGLRRDALANRAQRVRDRLEQCVAACLKKSSAI